VFIQVRSRLNKLQKNRVLKFVYYMMEYILSSLVLGLIYKKYYHKLRESEKVVIS
jgi:flagellar biosynthesis/type III secretory pathway M-ring protein FliF/YscJ